MRETMYAAAGLVLLIAIYVGSYFVMIVPDAAAVDAGFQFTIPVYRFGGESAHAFYQPVHEIDRRMRPERWRPILASPLFDVRRPEEHDDAP